MSGELDPLRRLRPDRDEYAEPNDPWVLAEERQRLMQMIDQENRQASSTTIPRIYPRLAYDDEYAALEFLVRAFGFRERREARMEDDEWGMLAWLDYGDGVLMIGRSESEVHQIESPRDGPVSCMLNVLVDDIDAHYDRAMREGARIVMPINDAFYGYRRYEALDLEGHRWHFAEPLAQVRARRDESAGDPS
jgi:uncharacterized glyoxalase superfamily protein PhnB